MREATQILVSQGLVRREIHRGAYVAELDADDVRDIFRVRRLVELTALRELFAEGGRPRGPRASQVAAMVEAVATEEIRAKVLAVDLGFHQTLVALMSSDRLGALYESIDAETTPVRRLVRRRRPAPAPAAEGPAGDPGGLAASGDPDKASAILERHLDASERRLLGRFLG